MPGTLFQLQNSLKFLLLLPFYLFFALRGDFTTIFVNKTLQQRQRHRRDYAGLASKKHKSTLNFSPRGKQRAISQCCECGTPSSLGTACSRHVAQRAQTGLVHQELHHACLAETQFRFSPVVVPRQTLHKLLHSNPLRDRAMTLSTLPSSKGEPARIAMAKMVNAHQDPSQ